MRESHKKERAVQKDWTALFFEKRSFYKSFSVSVVNTLVLTVNFAIFPANFILRLIICYLADYGGARCLP
jgi:hypothetical protein